MSPVLSQHINAATSSSPLAFNVAALDYDNEAGSLVTDYVSALETARNLGLGLVASHSISEAQAISILASALSSIVPTAHVYGGIRAIRESNKSGESLSAEEISATYKALVSVANSDSLNSSASALLILLTPDSALLSNLLSTLVPLSQALLW